MYYNDRINTMYVVTIGPTNKSKKWIKKHKLNLYAMSSALSLLLSEIHPSVKAYHTKITLQIRYNKEESEYTFKTNKISLCEMPYSEKDSDVKKQHEIFNHFLHEFRHWMQSKLYKASPREIKYTEEDVLYNTNAYYRNKLEIDARQFVRQYLTKFLKYYNIFNRYC